jgi:hypothetical protein
MTFSAFFIFLIFLSFPSTYSFSPLYSSLPSLLRPFSLSSYSLLYSAHNGGKRWGGGKEGEREKREIALKKEEVLRRRAEKKETVAMGEGLIKEEKEGRWKTEDSRVRQGDSGDRRLESA